MADETNAAGGKPEDGQADVAGRNAASTSAEGDSSKRTQLAARRQSAADSSVSPKSSTLQNPDAEIRADLTQDVLTANREQMQREVREAGGSPEDAEKMQSLHQAVADAQGEVEAAIRKRDAARDAYDREAEAQASSAHATHGAQVSGYLAAQSAQRDRQARLNQAATERTLASDQQTPAA